jgi:hypothetical protein
MGVRQVENVIRRHHFVPIGPREIGKERKMKITEDWLSVILAFALMFLAVINLINPNWVKF